MSLEKYALENMNKNIQKNITDAFDAAARQQEEKTKHSLKRKNDATHDDTPAKKRRLGIPSTDLNFNQNSNEKNEIEDILDKLCAASVDGAQSKQDSFETDGTLESNENNLRSSSLMDISNPIQEPAQEHFVNCENTALKNWCVDSHLTDSQDSNGNHEIADILNKLCNDCVAGIELKNDSLKSDGNENPYENFSSSEIIKVTIDASWETEQQPEYNAFHSIAQSARTELDVGSPTITTTKQVNQCLREVPKLFGIGNMNYIKNTIHLRVSLPADADETLTLGETKSEKCHAANDFNGSGINKIAELLDNYSIEREEQLGWEDSIESNAQSVPQNEADVRSCNVPAGKTCETDVIIQCSRENQDADCSTERYQSVKFPAVEMCENKTVSERNEAGGTYCDATAEIPKENVACNKDEMIKDCPEPEMTRPHTFEENIRKTSENFEIDVERQVIPKKLSNKAENFERRDICTSLQDENPLIPHTSALLSVPDQPEVAKEEFLIPSVPRDNQVEKTMHSKKKTVGSKRKTAVPVAISVEQYIFKELTENFKKNIKQREFTIQDVVDYIIDRFPSLPYLKVMHGVRAIFLNNLNAGTLKLNNGKYSVPCDPLDSFAADSLGVYAGVTDRAQDSKYSRKLTSKKLRDRSTKTNNVAAENKSDKLKKENNKRKFSETVENKNDVDSAIMTDVKSKRQCKNDGFRESEVVDGKLSHTVDTTKGVNSL